MKVLLWRGWRPAFTEGVTFSRVHDRGIGGTEMQMLWHAQHLVTEGHRVQVLGATYADVDERGVDFVGAADRTAQEAAIARGRISRPELVLLEGAFHAAAFFKERFPGVSVVHVGQNIDVLADRSAFAQSRHIDLYAFVSVGHLADYCSRRPDLRHKFILIRNAIPWREFHGRVAATQPEDKVVWVGGWTKKGLRVWCQVLAAVLRERPGLRWVLCGPAYESQQPALPRHLTWGLDLPSDRVTYTTLPLPALLHELATSRAVTVSLGNESGPASTLDAHAMGRPVISGNDMVYKFMNPEGTGLRATSVTEALQCLTFLLDNPSHGDAMGNAARRFVQSEYHEDRQREDLTQLIDYVRSGMIHESVVSIAACPRWRERMHDLLDRGSRRWRRWRAGD